MGNNVMSVGDVPTGIIGAFSNGRMETDEFRELDQSDSPETT